jgi:enoyl-CoA hydratase/carnithine racemase
MNHVDTSKGSLIHNDVVRLHEIAPGGFVVVIDNPPVNLVDSQVFAGLQSVRSIPDAELDAHVHRLARRIASFNPAAVAMAKSYLTKRRPIPLPADLADTSAAAGSLLSTAAGQAVVARRIAKAGGSPFGYEVELDLPKLCDVD